MWRQSLRHRFGRRMIKIGYRPAQRRKHLWLFRLDGTVVLRCRNNDASFWSMQRQAVQWQVPIHAKWRSLTSPLPEVSKNPFLPCMGRTGASRRGDTRSVLTVSRIGYSSFADFLCHTGMMFCGTCCLSVTPPIQNGYRSIEDSRSRIGCLLRVAESRRLI